jgi:hypothetical protein
VGSKALLLSLASMSSCAIALRQVMSAQSFLRRSSLPLRSLSTSDQMSSPKRSKSSAIELGCALCRSSVVLFVRLSVQEFCVVRVVCPERDGVCGLRV